MSCTLVIIYRKFYAIFLNRSLLLRVADKTDENSLKCRQAPMIRASRDIIFAGHKARPATHQITPSQPNTKKMKI